jgi:elongation factor G
MKKFEVSEIRNVGIFGHGGDGKTSLAEAILFDTGTNNRLGSVDEGSSLMDYDQEEIHRKITIGSSLAHTEWNKHKLNLIDTPGYADFIADARSCMRVVDGAVIVVGANSGVNVQTETVWGYAQEFEVPVCIYLSKMDMERADFQKALDDIKKGLSSIPCVPIQLPVGIEAEFKGVVDLIQMKAYYFKDDFSGKFELQEVPAELSDEAAKRREQMIETLVETDDGMMEKYLEEGDLSQDDCYFCLKKGLVERTFAPILCGASTRNMGIQPLLDMVVMGFPSPQERDHVKGKNAKTEDMEEREAKEDGPFSAFVFKTIADPYAGKLTVIRVYSGMMNPDSTVYNSTKKVKERIGQVYALEGKKQKPLGLAMAGDIVAVAKLKETTTGDTFCDEKNPILFEPTKLPLPIISFALTPKSKGDEDKITSALVRLSEEDPTIGLGRDEQTGQILLSGMGQVHVEVILDKLKRKFGVAVDLSTPKVPYKETIRMAKKGAIYRHKKQTGGRGQFAEVHFDISPLERGAGYEFENALTGMNVPRNFVPAVEKGIAEAMQGGVLAGYPVVDFKVRFYDGKSHEVDSSEMAFKIAAIMALKQGMREANPVLLEPIMEIEVSVPEENMGDIIGDLNSRRGKVLGVDPKGNYQAIRARVPMAEVLKYAPDLNSMTGGRGQFSLQFSHYEEVPSHLSEKVVAQSKKEE